MMKVDSRGPASRLSRRRRRSSSGLASRPERRSPTLAQSRQKRSSHAVETPATAARSMAMPMTARIALGIYTAMPAGIRPCRAKPSIEV
jgi:hypothetical protein